MRAYKPPKDLNLPQRYLAIFRDKEDFTGVEYHQSLEKHLKGSGKMILICSPDACKSTYVNDDITHFIELHGAENIIPVLLSGIPNNEAKSGQEEETCFPQALTNALEMPLAVNYKGFHPEKDKIDKGNYYGPWFTLLANLYGISRTEIEERDKKRRTRNYKILGGIATGFVAALVVAFIVTLHERNIAEGQRKEAVRQEGIAKTRQKQAEDAQAAEKEQRKKAEASAKEAREQQNIARKERNSAIGRQLAAQSELVRKDPGSLALSGLLAVEALKRSPSLEADRAARNTLELMPILAFGLMQHLGAIAPSIGRRW